MAFATLATAGLFNAAHATYPGENGVIVFDSPTGTEPEVIKRVSRDNNAVTNLASGKEPSVSPNGLKIAFTNNRDIYVMDIDGRNVVQLTNDHYSYSPTWLPDGSKVVYGRLGPPDNVFTLWTINANGTGKTFLRGLDSGNSPLKFNFAWSPAYPTLFAFDGGNGLKTGNTVNPTISLLAPAGGTPSWEPDGKTILFSQSNSQFEMAFVDTSPRALAVPPNGTVGAVNAVSPDGAFVVGGDATQNMQLRSRARNGTPSNFYWETNSGKTDWSRVPKNCYISTPQGGGEVLANNTSFYASQCAIAVMPGGSSVGGVLQQAIAIGPDQRLYHRTLKPYPSGSSWWSSFAVVPGGGGNPNGIKAKKIAIAAAKDGSVQVVIINAADDAVYHAMRHANGTWSGFNPLDGFPNGAGSEARDVAITINGSSATSPGNAQVIANNLKEAYGVVGGVFHRVRWVDGSWSPFAWAGEDVSLSFSQELAIAADENGYTDILATGGDGRILHVLRNADSSWGSWADVGVPAGTTFSESTDVAVTRTLKGTAQLVFTDAAGNVVFQERTSPNSPDSWKSSGTTSKIASTVGRGVSISAGPSGSQLLFTSTFPQ